MQEHHDKQMQGLEEIHWQELDSKEILRFGNIIAKAFKWFPILREMLWIEKLCRLFGFTEEMTDKLVHEKETLVCSGKIYSEEHKRKFHIKNDTFEIEKNK